MLPVGSPTNTRYHTKATVCHHTTDLHVHQHMASADSVKVRKRSEPNTARFLVSGPLLVQARSVLLWDWLRCLLITPTPALVLGGSSFEQL